MRIGSSAHAHSKGSSSYAHIIVCVCYGIFTQLTSLAENNQGVSNSSHVYVTATFSQSFEFIIFRFYYTYYLYVICALNSIRIMYNQECIGKRERGECRSLTLNPEWQRKGASVKFLMNILTFCEAIKYI